MTIRSWSGKPYNPRRIQGYKRDQLRKRVLAEETHCWLCGLEVDTSLAAGQPASPEVDEIVPVSKGGSHLDRSNVRLAHRICNQRRGNRDPLSIKKRLPKLPVVTSRSW